MFKYLMSTTTNKLKKWSQTTIVLRWTTLRKKKITLIDQATRNLLNQFMKKVLLKTYTSLQRLLHLADKMHLSQRKKIHLLGSTLIAPSSQLFRNTLKSIHLKGNLTFHTQMRIYQQKILFLLTNMWNLSVKLLNLKNILQMIVMLNKKRCHRKSNQVTFPHYNLLNQWNHLNYLSSLLL